MKPIKILKQILNAYYYILGIGLIVGVVSAIAGIIMEKSINSNVFGQEVVFEMRSFKTISIALLLLVIFCVYFKAISLLNKSLDDLSSGNYFSNLVINNFKKIGILFLICGSVDLIGEIVFSLLLFDKIYLKLDYSIILFIIIGLFFMFLSEVFKEAKMTKQENELTI